MALGLAAAFGLGASEAVAQQSVITVIADGAAVDIDISCEASVAAFGNASNVVINTNVGAGAHITAVGWDVTQTAIDPSWLSEMRFDITDSAITVGVGAMPSATDGPGVQSNSSGGPIDLIGLDFDFNVGADGILRLELSETFVDFPAPTPDGFWGADCNGGGPAPDSNCCVDQGDELGCDDPDCETLVCNDDPFCCMFGWDDVCADLANEICDVCQVTGPPPVGPCCQPQGGPGCSADPTCEADVCGCDPFCCDVEWDDFCATTGFDPDCLCGAGTCGAANTPSCNCTEPPTGDCCAPQGGPGCSADPTCEADVCGCDPFCCDVEWDEFCATTGFDPDCLCGPGTCGAANTPSCDCGKIPPPGDCGPGAGDCFSANGTPGCEDVDCCNAICAADAFCCDVEWDGLCAGAAATNPACVDVGGCGDQGTGDCCEANGTPGCEDAACCDAVCACDPFCCDTSWDEFCSTTGFDPDCLCGAGNCGAVNTLECDCVGTTCDCDVAGGIGCPQNPACEACVCGADPFCCDTSWDGLCAGAASGACADSCCGDVEPTCDCDVAGDPGCPQNPACEACVCGNDAFCCDVSWDGLCAGAATGACASACCDGGVDPPDCGTGECCSANGTPGCEDTECCEAVCACDPFCCDTEWDAFCASTGFDPDCLCGPGNCGAENTEVCECVPDDPCEGTEGDCCDANGTPGCDDADCCAQVCGADAFCCDVSWDGLCAGAANDVCEVCQPEPCDPEESCNHGFWKHQHNHGAWVGHSPADNYDATFGTTFAPTSDCCAANGTPGCDDADCQAQICAADPFCCNTSWDGLCGSAGAANCAVCQGSGIYGDATLDDALNNDAWGGSAHNRNLARDCASALLNAAHPDVCYPFTEDEVIEMCADAVGQGAQVINSVRQDLNIDGQCPLSGGPSAPQAISSDLNGDTAVDGLDLVKLIGNWGMTSTDVPELWHLGDLNNDGVIDGFDMVILLSNWGAIPH